MHLFFDLTKLCQKCYIFPDVRWILGGGGGKRDEKVNFRKEYFFFKHPLRKNQITYQRWKSPRSYTYGDNHGKIAVPLML
jgi:hypothetical protein